MTDPSRALDDPLPATEVDRLAVHESRTERPLLGVTVLFVAALCVPVLWQHAPHGVDVALQVFDALVWLVFAVDYVVRLRLSTDRRQFVRTHVFDLVVVVVPFARPLRLLRLLSAITTVARRSKGTLVRDLAKYVLALTLIVATLGAVATLAAERGHHGAVINSFWDALWYSTATMTAVPYGDVYPVTAAGRLISTFLQIGGLVLVGLVTAAVAAWLVSLGGGETEVEDSARLQAMEGQLAEIRAALAELTAASVPAQRAPAPARPRAARKTPAQS